MRAHLEHVALWVADLERMRRFYVEVLGGESGARYENPRKGYSSYFVSFGDGARVELMHRQGASERQRGGAHHGYAHIALSLGSRDAVDSAVAELRSRSVEVVSAPRTAGDGYYEAVILDPEGNEIELVA